MTRVSNASSNEQLLPTNKNFNGEENGKELNGTAIEKNGEKLTENEQMMKLQRTKSARIAK